MTDAIGEAAEAAKQALAAIKPKLRGWLHTGAIPAAAILGLILILVAPPQLRLAAIIYAVSCVALFSISATFHRGTWGPKAHGVLQRMDHATIFLLIAGSYTAFAAALLGNNSGALLLWIVWITAVLGMLFRILWLGAPRWLFVPVYISMGWAAMFWMPAIWQEGGAVIFLLLLGGGLMYSGGAVIYALRRPNPSPKWFGFHEVFHSFTLGGFVSHYIGISLAFAAFVAVP